MTDYTEDEIALGWTRRAPGAVGRSLAMKLSEFLSVTDFGAVADGIADDTAAINAAIAAAQPLGRVYFPAGTYRTGATIALGGSGIVLKGAGIGATILKASTAGTPLITLTDGSNRLTVSDMTLDSSVARTPGGYGIYSPGVVSNCTLKHLQVTNQYNGFQLGATDSSYVQHCFAQRNYHSGFAIFTVNRPSGGGCQWTMQNIVSELNDGHGIEIQALPYAGVSQMTLGGIMDANLFGNTEYGLVVVGVAACPVFGVRVNGMFSGQNGRESLYLNTYGDQHNIADFYFELDGLSTTGRAFATPPTGAARAMILTGNNKSMRISGGLIKAPALGGIINSCSGRLLANDIVIEDCGQVQPNVGIFHNSATGRLIMSGVASGNTGGGGTQTFGLYADDLGLVAVSGYDFTGNTAGAWGGGNVAQAKMLCGFPAAP